MGGDDGRRLGHDPGVAGDLETRTRSDWIAVRRVRRMPLPMIDKMVVLANVLAIHRGERDRLASVRSGVRNDGTAVGSRRDSLLDT
jgi:hypothetical protein